MADIYPACCLGPATSQCAIGLAWLLAAGGAHISRDERPGLAELFSVLGLLLRAGDLEALQPLLRDVKVCYAKSRDQALRDLSTPTPGDELIASSKEVRLGGGRGGAACLCAGQLGLCCVCRLHGNAPLPSCCGPQRHCCPSRPRRRRPSTPRTA